MEKEIYKDIAWYEWKYAITSLGKVWSYRSQKFMKQFDNWNWYMDIMLSKNHSTKHFYIHRLVASAFLKNDLWKTEVNHKNGIKTDNSVENLEWVSHAENHLHKYRVLKMKHPEKQIAYMKKTYSKPIVQKTIEWKFLQQFGSATEASEKLNLCRTTICQCARWERKIACGFMWAYL